MIPNIEPDDIRNVAYKLCEEVPEGIGQEASTLLNCLAPRIEIYEQYFLENNIKDPTIEDEPYYTTFQEWMEQLQEIENFDAFQFVSRKFEENPERVQINCKGDWIDWNGHNLGKPFIWKAWENKLDQIRIMKFGYLLSDYAVKDINNG